jgi:hypothetical protein
VEQTKARTSVITIGSTRYKQIDYSPALSSVFVKTKLDKKYRKIQEFAGEGANFQAYEFISDWVGN